MLRSVILMIFIKQHMYYRSHSVPDSQINQQLNNR